MYAIINNKLVLADPLNCRGLTRDGNRPTGYVVTKEDLIVMVYNPSCVNTMLKGLTVLEIANKNTNKINTTKIEKKLINELI